MYHLNVFSAIMDLTASCTIVSIYCELRLIIYLYVIKKNKDLPPQSCKGVELPHGWSVINAATSLILVLIVSFPLLLFPLDVLMAVWLDQQNQGNRDTIYSLQKKLYKSFAYFPPSPLYIANAENTYHFTFTAKTIVWISLNLMINIYIFFLNKRRRQKKYN